MVEIVNAIRIYTEIFKIKHNRYITVRRRGLISKAILALNTQSIGAELNPNIIPPAISVIIADNKVNVKAKNIVASILLVIILVRV